MFIRAQCLLIISLLGVLIALVSSAGCGGSSATSPPASGWRGLERSASYPLVGVRSPSLVLEDLTGDGRADIVLLHGEAGTASLLRGKGDGTFHAPTTREAVGDPLRSAIADLNEDGKPDLIVLGYRTNGIRVFLGQGDGALDAGTFYPLTGHGRQLAVGDMNADGHVDVLAVSDGSGKPIELNIFSGKGDGTLGTPWSHQTPYVTSKGMVTADVNRDGRTDILVGSGGEQASVLVFLGRGDGTCDTPTVVPILPSPPGSSDGTEQILCTDISGDSKPDLIVRHNLHDQKVTVRLGKGDGTFGEAQSYAITTPYALAVGDLNQDGKPDILSSTEGALVYLLNQGEGIFAAPVQIPIGDTPFAVAIRDLDGDTWPEVVTANQSGTVQILRNRR